MSQETLEIVGLAHERLNEGDIDGLIALCDGDFELDMSARLLNPETYRGHEGIRRFYREVCEVWEEFRWEPLRFFEAADKVVVLLHSHGRGRGSGLEMARDAAMVWTAREDRVVSVRFYIDQGEALEAAGLSE
jgi:ketosteroid isomerase-like protein